MKLSIFLTTAALCLSLLGEVHADEASQAEEPTHEVCLAEVAKARALAEALPAGDPSRIFALSDLRQALVEDGNGEFDDCVELAERATIEVNEHRHVLRPGETLDVSGDVSSSTR